MQARLKVLHDKANVKQVKLLPVTLIGRSTECNLKIASSQVSRNHCRITLGDDAVFVEDLGSANGTLLDGQPLPAHQPTAIAPGAHLIVGPAEFQIDYVASTSATMVLPRSRQRDVQDLPSTEMIFPVQAEQFAPTVAAAATVAPAVAVPAAAVPATDVPAPNVAEAIPAIPVAVPAAAAAVVAAQVVAEANAGSETLQISPGVELPVPASAKVVSGDTAILEPDSIAVDAEADESTQFMFQETIPDSIPFGNSVSTSEQPTKKGSLKSLFSLFGRKEKSPAAAAPSGSAQVPPAVAQPSVFLPTVEAQAPIAAVEAPVDEIIAGEAEMDDSKETTEFSGDQAAQTSTDEDNGFQQFLSSL